jgi:hypothetical protein
MARSENKDVMGAGGGLAAAIAVESGGQLGELAPVEARGYWEQVWRHFKRDKLAIISGVFIIFLVIVAAVGGPIAQRILGHGPSDLFFDGVNKDLLPVGPLTRLHDATGKSTIFILGADGTLGRDEFLRLLYGARVSLEVAVLSTITTTIIGVLLGSIAGYYRGWIDTIISRVIEITMAFPFLIFIIALAATVGDRLNNVTFGFFDRGVLTLLFVFTIFGWFYPARIVRRRLRLEDHLHTHPAAPRRADHRRLDAVRCRFRACRGGSVVPRSRREAPNSELGQPVIRGAELLHDATVAAGVARPCRAAHHAVLQPARGRPQRRLRPPLGALKNAAS